MTAGPGACEFPEHTRGGLAPQGWDWPHLGLGEAELRCQLGPLGQRQVLRVLEALVQVLQLQAGVDGPGLAQLLGGGLLAPLRGLGGLQGQRWLLRVWGSSTDSVWGDGERVGRFHSLICTGSAVPRTRARIRGHPRCEVGVQPGCQAAGLGWGGAGLRFREDGGRAFQAHGCKVKAQRPQRVSAWHPPAAEMGMSQRGSALRASKASVGVTPQGLPWPRLLERAGPLPRRTLQEK